MNKELLEFVQWLPNNSELFADLDLEASIAQINKLASSEEGKQTLEQLTNKYKNKEMELFKKGGKLHQLLCFKSGGKGPDCGCKKNGGEVIKASTGTALDGDWDDYHTVINSPGDTLRFKQYFSGPAYMRTHPEGGITYERSTRDGVSRMYGEGYKPSWWEKNILGYRPVSVEEKENWEQLIENHADDPAVKDKTKRKETKPKIAPILTLFRGLNAPSIDYSTQMYRKGGVLFAKEGTELGGGQEIITLNTLIQKQ